MTAEPAVVPSVARMGDNVRDAMMSIQVKLFNSCADGRGPRFMDVMAGTTVGEVARKVRLAEDRIFMVWVNGRDITQSLYDGVNFHRVLEDGDVVAFSGPVPYQWGFGAPIL